MYVRLTHLCTIDKKSFSEPLRVQASAGDAVSVACLQESQIRVKKPRSQRPDTCRSVVAASNPRLLKRIGRYGKAAPAVVY